MRLYVICRHCNQKLYFSSPAKTKFELPPVFQLTCTNFGCNRADNYTQNDASAESDITAASGAVLGGIAGLILGPEGAIVGATLGSLFGKKRQENEQSEVDRFNQGRF